MNVGKIKLTSIQRFSTQDGDGVRTVVFFKGCPLRCAWCHNPETRHSGSELYYNEKLCIGCGACVGVCPRGAHSVTQNGHLLKRDICRKCMSCAEVCPGGALERVGVEKSVDEIMSVIMRDLAFYGEKGGITLSGGEPFAQADGAVELLKAAKLTGITTAVETSGYFDTALLDRLCGKVDLFLWDVKDCLDERHKAYTGVSNKLILDNLKRADDLGFRTRIRSILVSGVNDDEANYGGIVRLYASLKNCEGVEILPYHTYGSGKNVLLGGEDNAHREWISAAERVSEIKAFLLSHGVRVI